MGEDGGVMEIGLNNKYTVFAMSTLQHNQCGRGQNKMREWRSDDKRTPPHATDLYNMDTIVSGKMVASL